MLKTEQEAVARRSVVLPWVQSVRGDPEEGESGRGRGRRLDEHFLSLLPFSAPLPLSHTHLPPPSPIPPAGFLPQLPQPTEGSCAAMYVASEHSRLFQLHTIWLTFSYSPDLVVSVQGAENGKETR